MTYRSSPTSFTVLQSTQVTRAKACPASKKCHFESKSEVATHAELKKYGKERDSATLSDDEQVDAQKSADEEIGVTMEFDVFETDFIGCTRG